MGTVNLVGGEGSGRLTFLAFLYAAMVRAGGDPADGFRFRIGAQATDSLAALFEQVRAGEPPHLETGGPLPPIAIRMGFSEAAGTHGSWGLHRNSPASSYLLDSTVRRWGPAELDPFLRSGGGLTEAGQALLDSDLLVLVVEATALASVPPAPSLHPSDGLLAAVVQAIFRAAQDHPQPGGRYLTTVVALTKADQLPVGGHDLGLTPPFPVVPSSVPRETFAARLLDRHLPQTARVLRLPPPAGLRVAPPSAVVTWYATQGGGQPPHLQGSVSPTRGWEPDYPYLEYRAVLECLRAVARARGVRGDLAGG